MSPEFEIIVTHPARRQIDQLATMRRRNITRIDNDANRTHAWLVQVRRQNHSDVKMFSDGIYGGKRNSLRAAINYHAQIMEEISRYEYQMWWRTILRRNNKSGIPGVGRYEAKYDGRLVEFWLASWIDEHGKGRKRKFSVQRYGENQARQLAIDERERQLERVCAARGAAESKVAPQLIAKFPAYSTAAPALKKATTTSLAPE